MSDKLRLWLCADGLPGLKYAFRQVVICSCGRAICAIDWHAQYCTILWFGLVFTAFVALNAWPSRAQL